MKKIAFLLSLLLVPCSLLKAQNEYMPISVVVEPLVEPFPETAQVQVTNQLTQLLTKNGIASVSDNCQFVLICYAHISQFRNKHLVIVILPGKLRGILTSAVGASLHSGMKLFSCIDEIHIIELIAKLSCNAAELGNGITAFFRSKKPVL